MTGFRENLEKMSAFANRIKNQLVYLAWMQALIATVGSLFFSEVMSFVPCELCWYQRILMYPLVLVLTIGILLRDQYIRYYALPLSLLGLGIAAYHNLLYYGVIPTGWHVCTGGVPCETRWIQWFGFVGIPFLSLTAFAIVTLSLLWYSLPKTEYEDNLPETSQSISYHWIKRTVSVAMLTVYAALFLIALTNGKPDTINKSIPSTAYIAPASAESLTSVGEQLITEGRQLYSQSCANCHGSEGQGVSGLGVDLSDSPFIAANTDSVLLEFIKTGRQVSDPENSTGMTMPGKGSNIALADDEILAIITYIRSISVNELDLSEN